MIWSINVGIAASAVDIPADNPNGNKTIFT